MSDGVSQGKANSSNFVKPHAEVIVRALSALGNANVSAILDAAGLDDEICKPIFPALIRPPSTIALTLIWHMRSFQEPAISCRPTNRTRCTFPYAAIWRVLTTFVSRTALERPCNRYACSAGATCTNGECTRGCSPVPHINGPIKFIHDAALEFLPVLLWCVAPASYIHQYGGFHVGSVWSRAGHTNLLVPGCPTCYMESALLPLQALLHMFRSQESIFIVITNPMDPNVNSVTGL
ncbi:hypothetical protein BCR44DRAFT_195518 [Catenaria anguillulae PL171]|uniref:Uncharacterized protein n=1 Tax=Catenaria anguillulae PL171 TaxID=765915 RepID=A0A1Y2HME1_9FUNG|nr:hypothetical protein BCR44DRAFT_195518 [Catenaria anguillulae PL171]